jgi:hypothetical protein
MPVNIWFLRKEAKEELKDTLFFSGMTYGEWTKHKDGYSIECSLGKLDIRSMKDVRLNGKKVGTVRDFKRLAGLFAQRG